MSIDRDKHETEITAAVLLVLIAMRDTLASFGSVSWPAFEASIVKAIEPTLVATFEDSSIDLAQRLKAVKPEQFGGGAKQWANTRAREIARRMRENTEQRVKAARERSTPDTFSNEIEGVFNPSRAKTVAASEVTASITAGERETADDITNKTDGKTLTPRWQTEQDSKVCPICRPLHGLTEDDWPEALRDGPPAHPNCRCELSWKTSILKPEPAGA